MPRKLRHVPLAEFGRDHWCTLGYIECICVDDEGKPDNRRMRCNPRYHPEQAHQGGWREEHSTRIKGHTDPVPNQVPGHDDWHCAEDLERAGLIQILGTGMNPTFRMTPLGQDTVAQLRRHKAQGGTWSTFDPLRPEPTFKQRHSAVQLAHKKKHEAKMGAFRLFGGADDAI